MKLRHVVAAFAVALIPSTAPASDIGLVKDLVGGLGVTPQQATGGAKALLDLAKTNLGADDYAKLAQAAPDLGSIMSGASEAAKTAAASASQTAAGAAKDATAAAATSADSAGSAVSTEAKKAAAKTESSTDKAASALLGAAAGAGGLGDLGKLTGNAGLVSKFTELGLKPEMIGKFAPMLFKNAMSSGGPAAASLLKKGLGL